MDPRLKIYLQQLITQAHKEVALPEVLVDKMVADLALQLESRLQQSILESLPEEDHVEYLNLTQGQHSGEQVNVFLEARISNFRERMASVTQQFADEYLAVVNQ